MAVVHSAGIPIHYKIVGSGRPIVLLYGFLSSFEANWGQAGWIEVLVQQGCPVVGLDCRAHGESGKPHDPATYTVQQMADDVTTVMDAAGVDRAHVMGYLMGGRLVPELLVRAPSRLTSAVIGGSALPFNTPTSAPLLEEVGFTTEVYEEPSGWREQMREVFRRDLATGQKLIAEMGEVAGKRMIDQGLAAEFDEHELASLSVDGSATLVDDAALGARRRVHPLAMPVA